MKLVLLSGGSGKRLWPLSNDARSKQFLKVLDDENKERVSMVQRVYNQLETLGLNDSTLIATSASQVEMIRSQIQSKVPIVIEPERRDTFPAIALSAAYLYSELGTELEEVVSILPVDPFVSTKFFEKVRELENTIINSEADLALIGVTPTYPSSKYGYIVPEDKDAEDYLSVSHFKEKPTEAQAQELINNGALWNCGVFAFKLSFIIDIIQKLGLPTNYQELRQVYTLLPKNSFDYEVVEKANRVVALPYSGYWKDLGTWNTLTEEMSSNKIGYGTISEDSENVHLINELDIPIAVLGASNLVVAASPDGILVSEKQASPRLKELIVDFDERPMYEEKIWGWYKVLDYAKYDKNTEVLTKKICILKDKYLSYHHHELRNELWTIIRGEGEMIIDGEASFVQKGDVIKIDPYKKHAIRAVEELEIIEVQTGSELVEEDIKDTIFTWEEITAKILK